jgi:exopolyphosphatase/guanosine-5'-triphosphate,3'-diphosphate pyrophosphatase
MSPASEPTTAAARPRQVAVLDLGTRAIRLDVAEVGPDGDLRVLESLQRAGSLGKDMFAEGRIDPASIEECVDILKGFRQVVREYGVDSPGHLRAVATSSVREAENTDAFLDRVYVATGLDVEVLEDAEVEHLLYLAVHDLFDRDPSLSRDNVLIAEAGGGGTRVLLIENGFVTYSGAFRLGSLRLREALDTCQTPADRRRTLLDHEILRTVNQMRQLVPAGRISSVVALAGDTEAAMRTLVPGWGPDGVARLRVADFTRAEELAAMAPDDLMREYGLPPHEAETAGQALLIYDRIARAFEAESLLVTGQSMRRGLLMKMAGAPRAAARFAEQLVHSATTIGRKYRFDERHARHVADLSVALYRQLRDEHGLGAHHEVLLRAAAILHDIGAFVSMASHHKHSLYLIRNSEIFGLARRDNEIVALVARYHRRAHPRPTHPEFMALDREGRVVVSKLAAILRVADALDRSHLQHIRDPAAARRGRQLVLTVPDVDDFTLERLAMGEKAGLFRSVYGLEVVLQPGAGARGTVLHGQG